VRDPAAARPVVTSGQTRPQDVGVPGTGTAPHMGMVRPQAGYGGVNLPGTFNPQAGYGGVNLPGTFQPQMEYSVNLPGTFQPQTAFGGVNLPGTFQPQVQRSVNLPGTFIGGQVAPRMMMAPPPAPYMGQPPMGQAGAPVLQHSGPMAGSYGSSVGHDGTYWEKVSGPTSFGNTVATSVICKRKLPTQVVNPVIGVPTPVPVPVQQGCETVKVPGGRYGQSAPGRWVQ